MFKVNQKIKFSENGNKNLTGYKAKNNLNEKSLGCVKRIIRKEVIFIVWDNGIEGNFHISYIEPVLTKQIFISV